MSKVCGGWNTQEAIRKWRKAKLEAFLKKKGKEKQ